MERVITTAALFLLLIAAGSLSTFDLWFGSSKHEQSIRQIAKVHHLESERPSIKFSSPHYPVRYGSEENEMVEFEWSNTDAEFTFEISDSRSFKRILMREVVNEPRLAISMTFPTDAYYRVKDSRGNFSEIRHLTLLRPQAPQLEVAHRNPLHASISTPTLDSKAVIQVALDPEFKSIVKAVSGLSSKYILPLPAGKYFVRARLEYKQLNRDFSQMTSAWSGTRKASVR